MLIVLAVLLVAVLGYGVYRVSSSGGEEVVQSQEDDRIVTLYTLDGQTIEMRESEARALEQNAQGYYRNPETGEFDLVWQPPGGSRQVIVLPPE